MNVLLVEDDTMMAEAITDFFKKQGIPYQWAVDFKSAQDLLASHRFDVVVTDFWFPGGNGDAVLALAVQAGIKEVFLNSGTPEDSKQRGAYTRVLDKSDPREFKAALQELKKRLA